MLKQKLPAETIVLRTVLAGLLIVFAAILRVTPHPWNFTPIGAMALFSGATVKDRRVAFAFPLLARFAGDVFVGLHKLIPVVYASFLVNVLIGAWVKKRRSVPRIGLAVFAGALQFFLVTNFGMWAVENFYPHTSTGLIACYIIGIPLFWNTLAGDALYSALLFGSFALAERFFPVLRASPAQARP
jgi:hypothetical protein